MTDTPVKVVVVDDHAMFRRGVTAELAASAAGRVEIVGEAEDVPTAVAAISGASPDVVLLDVHLPDINGLEVCRQIKADPANHHIKVVQVSASVRAPLDQLHCLEEGGADMYLTEPMSRGTLLSVIDRLMNGTAA